MRAIQNSKYGYIYNAWSDQKTVFKNEPQNGLTFKAMQAAGKNDPVIAERVKLFQYRVKEEFYDFEKDPNALNNLINDPELKDEIAKMRQKLYEKMFSTDDPLTQQYVDEIMSNQ